MSSNYLLIDIDGEIPPPTWATATEEGALRLVAGWIAEGFADATYKLVMVRHDLHSTVPMEALYAGRELRQRATNLLNRDALVSFLAGRPYVHELYESINERDGMPHYTVIVDEIDHETELPLFGFLGEVFCGHPGVYAEMTVLRESECGDYDKRYRFGDRIPLSQETP